MLPYWFRCIRSVFAEGGLTLELAFFTTALMAAIPFDTIANDPKVLPWDWPKGESETVFPRKFFLAFNVLTILAFNKVVSFAVGAVVVNKKFLIGTMMMAFTFL